MARRPAVHLPTLLAFLGEWAICVAVIAGALAWWTWWTAAIAIVVVATRQHALFILYHDAVHGLVARDRRVNDLIVNAFVGVPLLLPVHVYRSLHLVHHQQVGTERDPERVLLYRGQPWDYRPLPLSWLALQILGDLLLVNQLVMLVFYVRERLSPDSTLALPRQRWWPELALMQAVFVLAAAAIVWADPTLAWRLALLWFLPHLTLVQLIQKVRSFAEHGADELSYSWRPGWLGRWTVWPYHIQYHREHHEDPTIPWDALPARFADRSGRPGRRLLGLLWDGSLAGPRPAPQRRA